jgi:hypothetical protein
LSAKSINIIFHLLLGFGFGFSFHSKTVDHSTANTNLHCHKGILLFQIFNQVNHDKSRKELGKTQITLLFGRFIFETCVQLQDIPSQDQQIFHVSIQAVVIHVQLSQFILL